jgi:hypothetical protein
MITGLSLALMSNKVWFTEDMIFKFWVRNIYHVQSKSASRTSSSVLLNESTRCVGISDKSYGIRKQEGQVLMTTFRTVVSSVAKVCFYKTSLYPRSSMSISTLVYPTRHTNHRATIAALRSHLFVDCFDFIFQ